jgi:hypothetical protein
MAPMKPNISGGQMAASACVNAFFIVNTLVDLSVAHWALAQDQLAFLQQVVRLSPAYSFQVPLTVLGVGSF